MPDTREAARAEMDTRSRLYDAGASMHSPSVATIRAALSPDPVEIWNATGAFLKCDCVDVEMGTYANSVALYPPPELGLTRIPITVDRCIADEVESLWNQGIVTTGNCCGHNTGTAFISVIPEQTDAMKAMGYRVHFNECRPDDEDEFIPLSLPPREGIGG